ncbi:hypothetical protein GCM10028820_25120 [Tessaracoccus terricola]
MSENGSNRPRRAAASEPEDFEEPNALDDTPAPGASPARRGTPAEVDTPDSPTEPVDGVDVGSAAESPSPIFRSIPVNPFARPGSASANLPASAPVLPARDYEDLDAPTEGRRISGLTPASLSEPTPTPRRSAVSSITPPEDEMIPAPAASVGAGGSGTFDGPADGGGSGGSGGSDGGSGSWFEHHRRTLLVWVVGALVAALVILLGAYLVRRSTTPTDSPTPTLTSDTASPSESPSPEPEASVENLMTVADAELVVPDASWVEINTAEETSEATANAACLSSERDDVNPVQTFQRTLGTSDDDMLAAMHQIDVYATVEAAAQVQAQRVANLAACDEVPALIIGSTAVYGLADESQQLTIAYENAPMQFHTVLLLRNGRALTIVDITRDGTPVPAQQLSAGIERSVADLCTRTDGACPSTTSFGETVPPPSPPEGWLLTADLPRINAGTGAWTANEPGELTSQGMNCENLPLATEPGPSSRQQRTYLLTQDAAAPTGFGMDEMVFEFDTPEAASQFVTKLGNNIASCKDRVLTATVTELPGISGVGADNASLSARSFLVQQATSDDTSVLYQLSVTITGQRVGYLLTTVTEDFRFTDEQFAAVVLRASQRLSQ